VVLEIERDNQRLTLSAIPKRFFIATPGNDPTTVGLIRIFLSPKLCQHNHSLL